MTTATTMNTTDNAPQASTDAADTTSVLSTSELSTESIDSVAPAPDGDVLDFHRGAIDQTTITTRPPPAIMKQVDVVLQDMGVEVQKESKYRYRCVRPQKGAPAPGLATGADAPAAAPTPTSSERLDAVSPERVSSPDFMDTPTIPCFPMAGAGKVLYGSPSDDSMAEVRFSVEVTQLAGLKDTYSLDIRRLKGNLKSYSFIYNTIRERAELNQ